MNMLSFWRRARKITLPATLILLPLLAGCGNTTDNPPGTNSGSSEYALGTFDFNTINTVDVGQSSQITDTLKGITVSITASNPRFSTATANQDVNYNRLPDNQRFLLVDVTLTNVASPQCDKAGHFCSEQISSLQSFRLKDNTNHSYPLTTGAAVNKTAPDGTVLQDWSSANLQSTGNTTFHGELAFLIPDSGSGYKLYFEPNPFSNGTIAINLGI